MIKSDYIPHGKTYLDTAKDGLLSKIIFEKISKIRKESWEDITTARDLFITKGVNVVRNSAAKFLNCAESEVCLVNSFSVGFNFILPSLTPWKKVLILENDYPSLYMPLGLRDFEIHSVQPDENMSFHAERIILEADDFKPDIIAVSHVQYTTGFKCDIEVLGKYCKANNIIFIVDATQSLGCVPLDMQKLDVDILAASTYKWMCAGHGAGILYVSEKLQEKINFKIGYYEAFLEFGYEWKTKQNLKNLEAGHKDLYAFYRLGFALDDMLNKDMNQVLEHNRSLVLKLRNILHTSGYDVISNYSKEHLAGILVVKENEELMKKLDKNNIIATHRAKSLRFSCHFYNDESDLDQLR